MGQAKKGSLNSYADNYSPYNCINSASQVVDSLVSDYLEKKQLFNKNQQIDEDFSWKHDPAAAAAKYYSNRKLTLCEILIYRFNKSQHRTNLNFSHLKSVNLSATALCK